MMGHSHAVSGALAWTLTAPAITSATNTPLNLPVYLTGIAVTAGCALLPDLDHPESTIARTFGPLTQAIAAITNVAAGGHRKWTHTLVFTILSGLAAWFALNLWPDTALFVIAFLTTGLALRGLHLAPRHGIKGWGIITALSAAAAYFIVNYMPDNELTWVPLCIALGVAVHCLGDACTPGQIQYLLPWKRKMGLPLLPATGSFVETGIVTPLMAIGAGAMAWVTLT